MMAEKPSTTEAEDPFEDEVLSRMLSGSSADQSTPNAFVNQVTKIFGGQLIAEVPEIDAFTGCRLDFNPDDFMQWSGPPPMLPGIDRTRRLHPARGQKDGPMYVSPNITPSDPPWIKMAYMKYPMDRASLAGLLEEIVPDSLLRTLPKQANHGEAVRRGRERSQWVAEITALQRLKRDPERELYDEELTEAEVAMFFSPLYGIQTGSDLIDLWREFQRLAIFVLWIWGVQHKRKLPVDLCLLVANRIGRIWQETHPMTPYITAIADEENQKSPGLRADLEQDRKDFARRQRNRPAFNSLWQSQEKVLSVARITSGLVQVIAGAGYWLELCPNCERIFWHPARQRLFCSPYCRTIYNRKRGEGLPSLAEHRRRGQENI